METKNVLNLEEKELFLSVFYGLIEYTNTTFKMDPTLGALHLTGDYRDEQMYPIRNKLWEQGAPLIRDFVTKNPYHYSFEQLQLAKSWENFLSDQFVLFRH